MKLCLGITVLTVLGTRCLVAQQLAADRQSVAQYRAAVARATILYTGRLFGYMRGTGTADQNQCPTDGAPMIDMREVDWWHSDKLNKDFGAKLMPCRLQREKEKRGAVLVGMGDNFAPAYLARFTPQGTRISHSTDVNTISDDSVALFLYRAGYDALVPGKEDFYFGAYHLMQLSRVLQKDGHGIMLGANLFLQQTAEKTFEAKPEERSRLAYVSKRTGITPQFSAEATPWLVSLKFDLDPRKVNMPNGGELCPAELTQPDRIHPNGAGCTPWKVWRKTDQGWVPGSIPNNQARYSPKQTFQFLRGLNEGNEEGDFISPGNYGFCLLGASATAPSGTNPKKLSKRDQRQSEEPYCQQIQIREPMFCHGGACDLNSWPSSGNPSVKKYQPYLLLNPGTQNEVAVFGVVDENLRSYIARENASWEPRSGTVYKRCATGKKCRTEIHVIAPDAALQQVLEHFSLAHASFRGIRILLAQMTKATADELAAHIEDPITDPDSAIGPAISVIVVKEAQHARAFDAAFARADAAHATPNAFLQVRNARKRRPAVFVPRPIFDDERQMTIDSLNILQIHREDKEQIESFCNRLVDDVDETECRGLLPPADNVATEAEKDEVSKARQRQAQDLMPYVTTVVSHPVPPQPTIPAQKVICKEPTDPVREALCDILRRYDQQWNHNLDAIYDSKWFEKTFQHFTLGALLDYSETVNSSPMPTPSSKAAKQDAVSICHADVALLQVRDFYFPTTENSAVSIASLQEVVDRILWKDDLLTETNLSGAQIEKLLDQSDKFEKEEKDASDILPDTLNRSISKAGLVVVKKQSTAEQDRYFGHADDFDDAAIYRVATTNHLARGETGYPDAAKPAVGKQQVFQNNRAVPISVLVCEALLQWADGSEQQLFQCRSQINQNSDYRVSGPNQILNEPPHPVKSDWSKIGVAVTNTFVPPADPYRDTGGEKKLESYPIWDINLDNVSGGYTLSAPVITMQNLKNFSGITNSDVSQPASSKLDIDQHLLILRRFRLPIDAGIEDLFQYTRQRQDSLTSPTTTSWPRDNFVIGPVLQLRGLRLNGNKYRPHFLYVFRPFQFAIQPSETTFTLSGANSTSALIHQARAYSFSPKLGVRLERDDNSYFETGVESQHNRNVLSTLVLNPGSGLAPCRLSAAQSLASCAKGVTLRPNTPPQPQYSRFVQHGMYWDAKLKLSFTTKLSYQTDTRGDLFANRPFGRENSALPRYDVIWGHSLIVPLIGNFSLEPRFEWVFYENKILGNNLTRRNFTMKLTYSFKHDSRVPIWNTMNYDSSGGTGKSAKK